MRIVACSILVYLVTVTRVSTKGLDAGIYVVRVAMEGKVVQNRVMVVE
jgi:hypothetical protein